MKNRKILLSTIILAIFVPIIINLSISFISWGSGSNDGWLGFWGGYLGALISIFGIYFQVTKSIEESEKNREEAKKSNDEKINSQQRQLTEQKINNEVHTLQAVRPFIRVNFCKKNLKIFFKGEINNIWFKYGDIYLPTALVEDRDSEEKLAHKQLGSLCTSPLVVPLLKKGDKEYRFILKVKTMHNEEVFIYHTPGNPDTYCYEKNNNDSELMNSDGYLGIKDDIEENAKIFSEFLPNPSWVTAVKDLDREYRKNEFEEI